MSTVRLAQIRPGPLPAVVCLACQGDPVGSPGCPRCLGGGYDPPPPPGTPEGVQPLAVLRRQAFTRTGRYAPGGAVSHDPLH
jgi:hypothetical protein